MNSTDATSAALGRARWRKSSHSQGQNTCVELASASGLVGVRDTKLGTESPTLAFPHAEWTAFAAAVKDDELSL